MTSTVCRTLAAGAAACGLASILSTPALAAPARATTDAVPVMRSHAAPAVTERAAGVRSCGTVRAPARVSYRLSVRGLSCTQGRKLRRDWYRYTVLGVGLPEWWCTSRGSIGGAADTPRSVRCTRGSQALRWTER